MSEDQWGPGDPSKWRTIGTILMNGREYDLIQGEFKHSYSSNNWYCRAKDSTREPTPFDGHRVLIDVELHSHNYLKESELSGDEVRKGGEGRILADGDVVATFFFREIEYALRQAQSLISKISEHPADVLHKDGRAKMVGRLIYYHNVPAVIKHYFVDDGDVIIASADGKPFPTPAWRLDNPEEWDDDDRSEVKDTIFSPHIWWWRAEKTPPAD